jgi:hypothetical protein
LTVAVVKLSWMKSPMPRLLRSFARLLNRWSRQQETALWQMSYRKTMRDRFAGIRKSDRVEAKLLLLALAPWGLLAFWDEHGYPRGIVEDVFTWLSVGWGISIFLFTLAAYWRHFRRAVKRKR